MGDIKARAKDVVRYEAFGDAGGVIEELVAQLEKAEAESDDALARIAEIAAKAYERAILDVGLNPDLANQLLDTNPYRKAVQS